jgi:hypothetical protein
MSISLPTLSAIVAALLLAVPAFAQTDAAGSSPSPAWSTVRVSDGAFEVSFPGQPVIMTIPSDERVGESRGRSYIFSTPDKRLILIGMFSDLPAGRFIVDLKGVSNGTAVGAKAFGGIITAVDSTPVDGYFCRRFSGIMGDSMLFEGFMRLRGNRAYTLMALRPKELDSDVSARFLGSFSMIEPSATHWIDVDLSERGYEVRLPSTPIYSEDTADRGRAFRSAAFARDNNTGQSYATAVYTFSRYYSAPNLDSHMLQFLRESDDGVAILHDSSFTLGGYPARDLTVGLGSTLEPERIRLVARGRRLFEALTLTSDTSRHRFDDQFFESLKLVGDDSEEDLGTPRTEQLLADLSSDDSVRHEQALSALSWYRPASGEIAAFIDALTKRYNDDELFYGGSAARLFRAIERSNEDSVLERIIEHYGQLSPGVKGSILRRLLASQSRQAIERFVDLVTSNPVEEQVWRWFTFWVIDKDRTELFGLLIPRLYTLLDSAWAQNNLMYLTTRAHDAGAIDIDDMGDDRARLIRVASDALTAPGDTVGYVAVRRSTAVAMLCRFEERDDVVELLTRYAVDSALDDAALAAARLIELDAAVPVETVRRIALSPYHRVGLYEACRKAGNVELFPPELLNQDRFAEGLAYGALVDEDEGEGDDDTLELVESRVVTIAGARGRAHLFRVRTEANYWFTTILVGLQPESSTEVATKADVITFGDSPFDDLTVDQHFAKLIEQAESELAESANAGSDEARD